MKPIWLIIAALGILLVSGSFTAPEKKWLVTEESRLEISGSSNINEFQCLNVSYKGNDTLYENSNPGQSQYQLNGLITIMADEFDCRNRLITNDFRKTLNAGDYPVIKVRFLGLGIHRKAAEQEAVKGQTEITIAGVSRKYDISCRFTNSGTKKARLTGSKTVKLSVFGLEPRPKVLGMIKVDDTVKVDFDLVIRSI